jgi:hypothetical protein
MANKKYSKRPYVPPQTSCLQRTLGSSHQHHFVIQKICSSSNILFICKIALTIIIGNSLLNVNSVYVLFFKINRTVCIILKNSCFYELYMLCCVFTKTYTATFSVKTSFIQIESEKFFQYARRLQAFFLRFSLL